MQSLPQIDAPYLLDTLAALVRLRSVLPHEQRVAEYIAGELVKMGLEPEWHEVSPGRPNVYACAVLGPGGRFLTLTGHTDTVDVARGWETDPFEPTVRAGRMYGLGAADMKAGLACALAALKACVLSPGLRGRPGRLGFAATVDEEGYATGARALLATAYRQSDGMLLAEPFSGESPDDPLPVAITGKVLYKLTVRGRAAHAFKPERGINAVEDAARIIAALGSLKLGSHPATGPGNLCTLKVAGGYREYAVVVPEACEVIVTRLLVPGESRQSATDEMQRLVASLGLSSEVTVETPPPFYEPVLLDSDAPLLTCLSGAYRQVFGRAPCFGAQRIIVDANIYIAEGGIPTVTFGPRGGGLHEAGEYVELASLVPTAEVYLRTIVEYLSGG